MDKKRVSKDYDGRFLFLSGAILAPFINLRQNPVSKPVKFPVGRFSKINRRRLSSPQGTG